MSGQTMTTDISAFSGRPTDGGGSQSVLRERIRKIISRNLDPRERLMIVLRFAESMTYREIGLVLEMTGEQVEAKIETLIGRMDARV